PEGPSHDDFVTPWCRTGESYVLLAHWTRGQRVTESTRRTPALSLINETVTPLSPYCLHMNRTPPTSPAVGSGLSPFPRIRTTSSSVMPSRMRLPRTRPCSRERNLTRSLEQPGGVPAWAGHASASTERANRPMTTANIDFCIACLL